MHHRQLVNIEPDYRQPVNIAAKMQHCKPEAKENRNAAIKATS